MTDMLLLPDEYISAHKDNANRTQKHQARLKTFFGDFLRPFIQKEQVLLEFF